MPSYPWPFASVTAPNYRSDIFAFTTVPLRPAGLAADTTPLRVKSLWVTNLTGVQQTVTIADGNGKGIINALQIPPHGQPFEIDGMALQAYDGLIVSSSINSGVQGEVEGWI
jgi:hypothetical protein